MPDTYNSTFAWNNYDPFQKAMDQAKLAVKRYAANPYLREQRRLKQQMLSELGKATSLLQANIQTLYRQRIGAALLRAKLQGWTPQGYVLNKDINKRNLVELKARQNRLFAADMGTSMAGAMGKAVVDTLLLPAYAYDAGQAVRNKLTTGLWKWLPTATTLYEHYTKPLSDTFSLAQGPIPLWQKAVQSTAAGLGLFSSGGASSKLRAVQKAKAASRLSRMRNVSNINIPKTKFGIDMSWTSKGGKLVPGNILAANITTNIPVKLQTGSRALQTVLTAKNFVASYFPTWLRSPGVAIKHGANTVKHMTPKDLVIAGAKATTKAAALGTAAVIIPASLKKYFDLQRYQIANNDTLSEALKLKLLQAMDNWLAYANIGVGGASFATGFTNVGRKYLPTRLLTFLGVTNGVLPLMLGRKHGTPINQQNIAQYRTDLLLLSDIQATALKYSKPDAYGDYLKRQAVQTAGYAPYMIPGAGYLMVPLMVSSVVTGKSLLGHILPGYDKFFDPGTTKKQLNLQLLQRLLPLQYIKALQIKQRLAQAMEQAKTPLLRATIRDQANALRAQLDAQLRQRMLRNAGSGTIFDMAKLYYKLTADKLLTPLLLSMFGNQLRSNPLAQQKVVTVANKKIWDAFAGLRQAKTPLLRSRYIKQLFTGNKNKQLVSRLLLDKALSLKSLTDISAAVNKGISNMSVDDMLAVANYAGSTKSLFGDVSPQIIRRFTPVALSRMQSFVDNAKGLLIFDVSKKLLAIRSAFRGNTLAFDKNPQVKKLQLAVLAKSWDALKNNPLLLHKAVSLWLRSKNMPLLADFLLQPFAFYGLLAVLIGAPLLMGLSAGLQAPQQQTKQYLPLTDLYATTLKR